MFFPMRPMQLVVLRDVRMEGGQTKNFAKVLECSRELKDILRLIKESTENQGIPSETTLPLEVNSWTFQNELSQAAGICIKYFFLFKSTKIPVNFMYNDVKISTDLNKLER